MAIVEQPEARETPAGREAARLLRNVRSLADMTAEIAAAHEFTTTARLLLLTMLGALSATRGIVWLFDPEDEALRVSVARGFEAGDEPLPLGEEQARALQRAGAPVPLSEDRLELPL